MHVKELAESSVKYDFECKTEILHSMGYILEMNQIYLYQEGQVKQMRSFADRCSNSRREGLGRRVRLPVKKRVEQKALPPMPFGKALGAI